MLSPRTGGLWAGLSPLGGGPPPLLKGNEFLLEGDNEPFLFLFLLEGDNEPFLFLLDGDNEPFLFLLEGDNEPLGEPRGIGNIPLK
jgi:hypothetical protein